MRSLKRGFTLIELIVGIVLLAVALTGILGLLINQAPQAVDPVQQVRAAQLAQRVQASYCYDNDSFSSEADRDDYIRRQLRDEISDEYADRHDGAYPDEEYLNKETERRFAALNGIATPETAAA